MNICLCSAEGVVRRAILFRAAVVAVARAVRPDLPVCYHSDGKCWEVIPDLIEIGVTVLNPVQPECLDVAEVKRKFGGRLAFWGGVGTQTTMPFADGSFIMIGRRSTCSGRPAIFLAPRTCWSRKCPGKTSWRTCVPWKSTGS